MAIFTTRSVVNCFSTGTMGFFATLVYVFTMRVVISNILSMAIIPTLSTSILLCYLCYILWWISPCGVVKKRYTDIANFTTLIHCVPIFNILYGNYYLPHGEFNLICIGIGRKLEGPRFKPSLEQCDFGAVKKSVFSLF